MSKKEAAKEKAEDIVEGVTAEDIKSLFFGVYGPQHEYDELLQEHYEMVHFHEIRAELEKDVIAERRRKRQELVETRRIAEEQRRIKEMRENPENLAMCAAKIQKFVRRSRDMNLLSRVRQACLAEKPNKRALVMIVNSFEDRRVRADNQAVTDAFDFARSLMCMGFHVDLLCDVICHGGSAASSSSSAAYDEFSSLYDDAIAQSDASGRAVSALSQAKERRSASPAAASSHQGSSPLPVAAASPSSNSSHAPSVNTTGGGGGGGGGVLRSIKPPTRQNIVASLAAAAQAPQDTLLWVHVCTVGGRAIVNGKNPARLAMESAIRTPRTRLMEALQSSNNASNNSTSGGGGGRSGAGAAAAAASDTCHFLFPSDGRSARLTFDNIIRVEEVLEVLNPKYSEQIFGQPLHQRIVSMDISPIGAVEGAQGGGFACFASTCTATQFYEMPARDQPSSWFTTNLEGKPTRGCSLGDPHTSLLTHALHQCLHGHCWSRIESTPRLYCGHVAAHVHRWMEAHKGVTGEIRGSKGWGEFPILEGGKLAAQVRVLEKVFATPSCAHEALNGITSSQVTSSSAATASLPPGLQPQPSSVAAAGSAANAVPRKQQNQQQQQAVSVPATSTHQQHQQRYGNTRGTLMEVTLRFDLTEDRNGVAGLDVFDSEFSPGFLQLLLVFFAHYDPRTWSHHRQLKTPMLRGSPTRTILIGLNTTFVEVSAKMKSKGSDPEMVWMDLVSELTGISTQAANFPHFSVHVGKVHEIGVYPAPSATALNLVPPLGNSSGGGIVLLIQLLRGDFCDRVLRRLDKIPEVIPGVVHSSVIMDVRCEVFSTASAFEHLNAKAKQIAVQPVPLGLVPPLLIASSSSGSQKKKDGDEDGDESPLVSSRGTPRADTNLDPPRAAAFGMTQVVGTGGGGGGASSSAHGAADSPSQTAAHQQQQQHRGGGGGPPKGGSSGMGFPQRSNKEKKKQQRVTIATDRGFLHMSEGEVLVAIEQHRLGILHTMTLQPIPQPSVAPTQHMVAAWGEYLDMCVQHLGQKLHKNVRALKHKLHAIRVLSVRALTGRVNEIDDEAFTMMAKRDLRPPASLATAPHHVAGGLALCVIALYHPTGEARCRQALHLQRVAQVLELVAGIRFVIWDVGNETFGLQQAADKGGAAITATAGNAAASGTVGAVRETRGLGGTALSLLNTQSSVDLLSATASSAAPAAPIIATTMSPAVSGAAANRQNIVRFLDTLKLNIGTNAAAYPVLMLWDLAKKRYYRLKAPQAGGGGPVGQSMLGAPAASAGGGGGSGGAIAAMLASSVSHKPPFVTGLATESSATIAPPPPAGGGAMRRTTSVAALNTLAASAQQAQDTSLMEGSAISPHPHNSNPVTGRSSGDSHMNSSRASGGAMMGGPQSPASFSTGGGPHIHGTAHIIFPAPSVAHLCEEFLKGNLNDLLPPVKGSKVIGGGRSMTKYSLMSL
ncbi:Hypothetical protein, putative [Bodo saltans]|uniref:Uncharacterized protein n=1 Tax=Bodo saltans TaxID=75058 RepID=A0A0S4JGC4_BODSA|nr:Hypothetical protein, putative [Bodo saltans]|eukprot:CUG88998.1 Hypothetical protein, putative [Bodo saltans]